MASYEAAIDRLEAQVEELRVDFERFFNGAINLPPLELREQIRQRIRRLQGANIQASTERFRLQAIEGRFNSLEQLNRRRERDLEATSRRRPSSATEIPALSAARGIQLETGEEEGKARVLYRALYGEGGTDAGFERFREQLGNQVSELKQRNESSGVRLRVVEEDGQKKLKAKPV